MDYKIMIETYVADCVRTAIECRREYHRTHDMLHMLRSASEEGRAYGVIDTARKCGIIDGDAAIDLLLRVATIGTEV